MLSHILRRFPYAHAYRDPSGKSIVRAYMRDTKVTCIMGLRALPTCDRKSTLKKSSGAVAAKNNCTTKMPKNRSVASSVTRKMNVTTTIAEVSVMVRCVALFSKFHFVTECKHVQYVRESKQIIPGTIYHALTFQLSDASNFSLL